MNVKQRNVTIWGRSAIVLLAVSCLIVFLENTSAAQRQKIVMGLLGPEVGQVGTKITNNYDSLPQAIAVDAKGSVYLADYIHDRVVKFYPDGRFNFNIPFRIANKRYGLTIDDIETDIAGNLYAASRHEKRLNKYDPSGNLLLSIDLDDKNICWDKKRDWVRCAIQISRLVISTDGFIYLRGFNELIKLSAKGNILKKWPLPSGGNFVLDNNANLYIARPELVIESYDRHGKKQWTKKCGETISRVENGYCRLPIWVDREGNYYWFEDQGSLVKKTDRDGNEIAAINLRPLHLYGNTVKFDIYGNLYFLGASKTDFWIEKISFDSIRKKD